MFPYVSGYLLSGGDGVLVKQATSQQECKEHLAGCEDEEWQFYGHLVPVNLRQINTQDTSRSSCPWGM